MERTDTYNRGDSVVWVGCWTTVPIQWDALGSLIVNMCIIRTRDREERLQDFFRKEPVLVFSRVVGHEIDDEVMSDRRHQTREWLG